MPLASIEPMALQSPGKAAHPGQGVHMNLVWQLAAKTLLSEETGHSFRLNIQAPRTETPLPYLCLTDMSRSPHSPLSSLHPLLLTANSSGKETVSLPPAVQRKPFQPSSAHGLQTMAVHPLSDPLVLKPRPHGLGHTTSLAPGFLSLSTSVLLLRDKLSVLLL